MAINSRHARRTVLLGIALLLGGCVHGAPPLNPRPELYSGEQGAALTTASTRRGTVDGRVQSQPTGQTPSLKDQLSYGAKLCPAPGTANYIAPPTGPTSRGGIKRYPDVRLSPGDRVNVFVFGSPEYSGDYVINLDGRIALPYTRGVDAVGVTAEQLGKRLETALIEDRQFKDGTARVAVRPVRYAPVNVSVAGAVFIPGRVTINVPRENERAENLTNKFGDSPIERMVGAALRAGGGVRPDADLSNVRVIRAGRIHRLDWRGAITGAPVDDMPLIEGDHIEVGESDCFQSALVRPSQITPGGVRLFISNLSQPAASNAQSTPQPQFTNGVPFGTRLLQGLVTANCVGGNYSTQAKRYAVLISRNPKTRETEVIQRAVEDLVRNPDRDAINPYLMPDDAIACYDSAVQETRDVFSVINQFLLPRATYRGTN